MYTDQGVYEVKNKNNVSFYTMLNPYKNNRIKTMIKLFIYVLVLLVLVYINMF